MSGKEATMKTQDWQGSFITVIWTLIEKVKEVTADSVPIHPRAEVADDLFLLPVVSRAIQRRLVEDAHLSDLVFRYSSSDQCAAFWAPPADRGCWHKRPLPQEPHATTQKTIM